MKTTKNFRPLVTSIGVEYDRYLVSDTGEIFDKSTNTFLKPYNSTNGHDYIILDTLDGKRIELIENIVFQSFGLLIPLDLMDCDILIQHYNGNSRDNFVDNLYPIKDIEIYKDIGELGYESNLWKVSNRGNLYGVRYRKYLKKRHSFSKCSRYYSLTGIRKKGHTKQTSMGIHRLVGMLFVSGQTDDMNMINHIDGNPANNHFMNLEWVDDRQNAVHARLMGLQETLYGEQTSGAKITESVAREICKSLVKYNGDAHIVADELNVPYTTVRCIKNGYSWEAIAREYFEKDQFRVQKFAKVLTENQVRLICEYLIKNNFNIDIVYDLVKDIPYMNREKVYRISVKDSWKNISDDYF